MNPLRRLYNWTMDQAERPWAIWLLGIIAFAEASFFPIPHFPLMIPIILAARQKWLLVAVVASVCSVLGGVFGYLVGAWLFDMIGLPLLEVYGAAAQFAEFQIWYDAWGFMVLMIGGFTPVPFKVVTIASGAAGMNFALFLFGAIFSRTLLTFAIAGVLWWAGPTAKDLLDRYLGRITAGFVILIAIAFLIYRYAH